MHINATEVNVGDIDGFCAVIKKDWGRLGSLPKYRLRGRWTIF